MSPTGSLLLALLFGALVSADALLQTEAMAKRAAAAGVASRRLWAAHFAQLFLLTAGFLLFAWTRLHFASASVPSWLEFLLLLAGAWVAHGAVDLFLPRSRLAEPVKVLALVGCVLLLQPRHPEWSLLTQGPILFLGQPVPIESFARNVILLFGLAWCGLAWRERRRLLWRLALVVALAVGTL